MQRDWLLWAVVVAVVMIAAAPILTYPLGRDQGEFAIIAVGILRGSIPYVDLWNPKPPAVFYTYAGLIYLLGQTATAIRSVDLLLFPAAAAGLFGIGRRLGGTTYALWTVLLYGVFYFTETFWTLSQNDGIATVPMVLAVWCVFTVLDRPPSWGRYGLIALSGALSAVVLWFKYPFVVFVIALVIGYLAVRRRWVWGEVLAFAAGGLVIGLGGIGYLIGIGAYAAWVESATVTAGYTAQGYDWTVFWADMVNYAGFRWQQWRILWILAVLWLPVRLWLPSPEVAETQEPSRWWLIGAWLIGALGAMLIQAKGYDYHWLPMLPPLILIGAESVERLLRAFSVLRPARFPSWTAGLPALAVGSAFVGLLIVVTYGTAWGYLTGGETRTAYYSRFVGGEFRADDSWALTTYLRERTAAGDSLFIWGFRPEVYYQTGLQPAARFIFQFPLVGAWYPVEWQQQTVDTLWASLPPYVVVVRGDFMPWVTGIDADSNMLLQDFTELNNWLVYNYEFEAEVANFLVWRRKAPVNQ